jgi:beta-glucanase (GH16 family)
MIDLSGYKLTFSDEFNTRSISQTGEDTVWSSIRNEWRYDANSDIGFGWSSFVDPASGYDPFNVSGGALTITASPNQTPFGTPEGDESGIITTQNGFNQTYGYFEMRADLNDASPGWDAFWLLPVTQIPDPNGNGHQELDIVEHYGGAAAVNLYAGIHTTDDNYFADATSSQPAQVGDTFHTYGLLWGPDTLDFYFDGNYVQSRPTPSDMHSPMYLLANLATYGDGLDEPLEMKIDYIRVFSNDPDAVAISQGPVSAPDGHDPGLYGAIALDHPSLAPPAPVFDFL